MQNKVCTKVDNRQKSLNNNNIKTNEIFFLSSSRFPSADERCTTKKMVFPCKSIITKQNRRKVSLLSQIKFTRQNKQTYISSHRTLNDISPANLAVHTNFLTQSIVCYRFQRSLLFVKHRLVLLGNSILNKFAIVFRNAQVHFRRFGRNNFAFRRFFT